MTYSYLEFLCFALIGNPCNNKRGRHAQILASTLLR